MLYNWYWDYILSKADKSSDVLGQKKAGSMGQLIYHPFQYTDDILANDRGNTALSQYASPDMNQPSLPMIFCPIRGLSSACVILPRR